eukprot:CAMPEP_0173238226 /NCGR_PEP_ID=MMETSP1142-20121109/12514_1 /TAXON_ID=483371 /ORGANISM="non described non described, Strain CCMP2298" /LENGTH=63 /DNA_ID=CAMNT_0014169055 /DNA_START=8 /DNA_END=196 /DNA_ORIENTATION=+
MGAEGAEIGTEGVETETGVGEGEGAVRVEGEPNTAAAASPAPAPGMCVGRERGVEVGAAAVGG